MSATSRVVAALSALGSLGALACYAYWMPPLRPLVPGFLPVFLIFFGGLALPYLLILGLLAWQDGRHGFRFAFGTGVVNAIWALPLGGLLFLLRGFAMGDRGQLNGALAVAIGGLLQLSLLISGGATLWRSRHSQAGSKGSPGTLRAWMLAFLFPVASSGGSFLYLEWQVRNFTLRSQQAVRNSRAAQETLNLLQACLSTHRERGYPATLGACPALSPRTAGSSGYRFEYLPAAHGADGRIGAYLLCAQPLSFRATGFETVVADSTGATWVGRGMEEATVQNPPTCASVLGAERAIAWCAFSFAAHDPGRAYPRRLADIAGCLSDGRKLARIGPDRLTDENGETYVYLAGVFGAAGAEAGFRIYRRGRSAEGARWSDDALTLSETKLPPSGPVGDGLSALAAPEHFEAGCSAGRGADCFNTGLEWQRKARQSEGSQSTSAATSMQEKAMAAFTRGCQLNEMRSCNWLASELESGKDVGRDLSRIAALHEKSCTLGYALGCSYAARMLESNDTARAVALYIRACDLDDLDACFVAARLLAAGDGMVADRGRALTLFSRACNDGMAAACSRAAGLSPGEAEEFRRRACALGGEEECRADREAGDHALLRRFDVEAEAYGRFASGARPRLQTSGAIQ